METECNRKRLEFHPLGQRKIVGRFDGGTISSDAGGLLLRECERATGIVRQFARCFTDHRDPEQIEHTAEELVAQRVYALALGYEDLIDHDALRHDPLLAALVGKLDPMGERRKRKADQGKALAGKSTLNRLELTREGASSSERYKKIEVNLAAVEGFLVEAFLQAWEVPPAEIVLDLDATDDPVHGDQEGRFFTGITTGTATCRCTSSAGSFSCARSCVRATLMRAKVPWKRCSGSWRRFGDAGRWRGSS